MSQNVGKATLLLYDKTRAGKRLASAFKQSLAADQQTAGKIRGQLQKNF